MRMRRIRKRKAPPTTAMASSSAAYIASFPRVTPVLRSSIAFLRTQGDSS